MILILFLILNLILFDFEFELPSSSLRSSSSLATRNLTEISAKFKSDQHNRPVENGWHSRLCVSSSEFFGCRRSHIAVSTRRSTNASQFCLFFLQQNNSRIRLALFCFIVVVGSSCDCSTGATRSDQGVGATKPRLSWTKGRLSKPQSEQRSLCAFHFSRTRLSRTHRAR